jgi:phytoene desaturase
VKKAIVIGSGIGGLASACRLATKGYDVTVFEANESYGGKLGEMESNGYRFDTGPSLFTMPHYLEELFEFCGETLQDYFEYNRLDESCKYFWEDGTSFTMFQNEKKLAHEAETVFGNDGKQLIPHLQKSKFIYDKIGHIFTENSLHSAKTWLSGDVLKALPHITRYGLNSKMHQKNKKNLVHPKLVQLYDRYATYNGSNPYQAPATLNLIPHLEHGYGTFFPKKGMRSIACALYALASKLGVNFKFNTAVEEIELTHGKASGIRTKGLSYGADIVVSNMDVYYTYEKLLPSLTTPKKIKAQERSSSAIIFYWGINRTFKELGVHNILFSNQYEKEFDHIFNKKTDFNDPSVYIHISSKIRKEDAPEGCENWFVMVNAPANNGQNWDDLIGRQKAAILEKLSRMLGQNISKMIQTDFFLDPRTIDLNTSSYQGSLYGTSSNSKMAAFARQKNKSRVKNLYFCGGSVHPGGGIPLCLMSAKIMSNFIPSA